MSIITICIVIFEGFFLNKKMNTKILSYVMQFSSKCDAHGTLILMPNEV